MEVNVKIDFREYISKIRYYAEGKVRSVTDNPDIKAEIYQDIYYDNLIYTPVDTGALQDSPESNHWYKDKGRYAKGDINEDGIYFDPYQVSKKTGIEHHYASYVRDFNPYWDMMDNKSEIYDIVKEHILEEVDNE